MNVDRLNRLATLLRTQAAAPPAKRLAENFNLSTWIDRPYPRNSPNYCGTTACAVGTALLDKQFNREGLKPDGTFSLHPTFEGRRHWAAVSKFFDIRMEEALWLFMDAAYPPDKRAGTEGELAVAEKIDCLIATKGKSIPKSFANIPEVQHMKTYYKD